VIISWRGIYVLGCWENVNSITRTVLLSFYERQVIYTITYAAQARYKRRVWCLVALALTGDLGKTGPS
jgi:hypothetical protein